MTKVTKKAPPTTKTVEKRFTRHYAEYVLLVTQGFMFPRFEDEVLETRLLKGRSISRTKLPHGTSAIILYGEECVVVNGKTYTAPRIKLGTVYINAFLMTSGRDYSQLISDRAWMINNSLGRKKWAPTVWGGPKYGHWPHHLMGYRAIEKGDVVFTEGKQVWPR